MKFSVHTGFRYTQPTILISPWIKEQTVFRSLTAVAYDSTSILATLLHWHGIPKARWGLGDRPHNAPTFEGVFRCPSPRSSAPSFTPPYDKNFPRDGSTAPDVRVTDLHALMTPRLIATLADGKLNPQEIGKLSDDILTRATDLKTLYSLIDDVAKRLR